MNINEIFSQLAQYKQIADETAAIIEGLQDEIKAYMAANGTDTVTGAEHKATYKAVTSSRVDTSALKKDAPEIAAQYTKTTTTHRFTFA